MNSREYAEEIANDREFTYEQHRQLARDYLALLDKLKNPSDEMIDAGYQEAKHLFYKDEEYGRDKVRDVYEAMAAVLLKEIEK